MVKIKSRELHLLRIFCHQPALA